MAAVTVQGRGCKRADCHWDVVATRGRKQWINSAKILNRQNGQEEWANRRRYCGPCGWKVGSTWWQRIGHPKNIGFRITHHEWRPRDISCKCAEARGVDVAEDLDLIHFLNAVAGSLSKILILGDFNLEISWAYGTAQESAFGQQLLEFVYASRTVKHATQVTQWNFVQAYSTPDLVLTGVPRDNGCFSLKN